MAKHLRSNTLSWRHQDFRIFCIVIENGNYLWMKWLLRSDPGFECPRRFREGSKGSKARKRTGKAKNAERGSRNLEFGVCGLGDVV